jgi:glycosyltransferase involved in cell wall biosynthesis
MDLMMCSNDVTFCPALSHAYARRGVRVAAGVSNLFLKLGGFDVVHFHWPEELVGFSHARDPAKTGPMLELIDWWRARTVLVATVHNLIPHAARSADGPEARYYRDFYERMDVIGHFSEDSRRRFSEAYPSIDPARQVVHGLNLFDHLLPLASGKAAARTALGLPQDKRIFAVVGTIRTYAEIALIERAWHAAAGPDDLLLFATALGWEKTRGPRKLVKQLLHRARMRGTNVRYLGGMLPEAQLVQAIEAADAILLARFGQHLNSGILPLAMTFGTPIVAPDYGIYRETIATPANELYEPRNAEAMARAIRAQSAKDPAEALAANRALAAGFGWDGILDQIWPAIEAAQAARLVH